MSKNAPTILIATLACFAIFTHVPIARAINMDADKQCPPGGKVGQQCKDVTNGYTTQGKCTHIYVCKASGSKVSGGVNATAQKVPTGGDSSVSTVPTGSIVGQNQAQSSTSLSLYSSGKPSYPLLANQGMYTSSYIPGEVVYPDTRYIDTVALTVFGGQEYLLTYNEILHVGDELTPENGTSPRSENFSGSGFTSFGGLQSPTVPGHPTETGGGTPYNGFSFEEVSFAPVVGSGAFSAIAENDGATETIPGMRSGSEYILYYFSNDPVTTFGVGALALFLLSIGAYMVFKKKKQRIAIEKSVDYSLKSKILAEKDTSVATPIPTENQEKTIWEHKPEI
ncbi:MAG: hypothetical protein Q8R25_00710 [bacterium]|nr:hypothetical protein [bacterium]